MIARLWQRIANLMAHGTISRLDDTGGVQKAQIQVGYLEVHDDVRVLQHFGIATTPPLGSDVVCLFFGGDRTNGLIVGHGDASTRPTGQGPGEATLYNAHGMSVVLSAAGIVINSGGLPVLCNGDLRVTGTITAGFGGADAVSLQTHRHGGVQSGGGSTAAPTAGT